MAVWYIPGWLRTHTPQNGVVEALSKIFPEAKVVFKEWDGDQIAFPMAVESAEKAVDGFVHEIIELPQAERDDLVLVGHSLGGRIATRILARLDERSIKIRQAALLGAAIPYKDVDVRWVGNGAHLPVLMVCNPDDFTLRYVYALLGGEYASALGANGALQKLVNVREYIVPASITKETRIDEKWAESEGAREIANHHALFYIACLARIVGGEEIGDGVMVPQDFVSVERSVIDNGVFWQVVDEKNGWKLERNLVTGHARVVDPQKVRRAWGTLENMRKSFRKVAANIE